MKPPIQNNYKKNKKSGVYRVVGLMSGTSLDGLDIAFCEFSQNKGSKWQYKILKAETIKYQKAFTEKLATAENKNGEELALLDVELGRYFGKQVNIFIKKNNLSAIDLVSSHGHTIFHRPEKSLTLQIGSGAHIAAATKLAVVCDFRRKDVAMGGQGAPLVPIGDKLLFGNYDFCINLGGIANVSYTIKGNRIAFDICPVNMVLNQLANRVGLKYDKGGKIASSGKINSALLVELNQLSFYKKKHPKSLGKEWVTEKFFPILNKFNGLKISDIMATIVEHIAIQIGNSLKKSSVKGNKVIFTGGGVFNTYLMERIKFHCTDYDLEIPSTEIINFKEALIFAFLGVLRWKKKVNCLKSVTGACEDNVGGCVYE